MSGLVWSWILEVRNGLWCLEAPGGEAGALKGQRNITQERDPGRKVIILALRKASYLGRGTETFFRGLMAPRIKSIQTQKGLSKRQPHPTDQGRRVQQSGCWGTWPAPLSVHGKEAGCVHTGFRNRRWLALFEVPEGKDFGKRPQLKMAPRGRYQLQFKPKQRDQLRGIPLSSICGRGRRNISVSNPDPQGPLTPHNQWELGNTC